MAKKFEYKEKIGFNAEEFKKTLKKRTKEHIIDYFCACRSYMYYLELELFGLKDWRRINAFLDKHFFKNKK